MVYSLVNAPTLVRDLARLPAGPALVTDLLHAFALTPADLETLEAEAARTPPLDADRRRSLVGTASARPRALALLATARSAADARGLAAYTDSLDALSTATIGGLDDLIRFVRTDVLAGAWASGGDVAVAAFPGALDVVTDGIVATYCGGNPAGIGRGWRRWRAAHPPAPMPESASLVVDAVRRIDVRAGRCPVVPADWAPLVHDACWAVHLSGRERSATITQLLALRALFEVTAPAPPGHALVATMVAAVHASVTSDLLAPDAHAAMMLPFFSLLS